MNETVSPTPPPAEPTQITLDDFKKIVLKLGKILEATPHPNANRLLILKVDLGGETRQLVAGIRPSYSDPAALVGREVVVVANLRTALLRGVESQGMILAASNGAEISLIGPDKELPPGTLVS